MLKCALLLFFVLIGWLADPLLTQFDQTIAAAPIDTAAIDAYLEHARQILPIPGMALGIVRDGEIIYLKGYGEAAPGRAATPQTPFHLGSVGKTFTALAIMQLANEGRLALSDPLKQHLPEFTTAAGDERAWKIRLVDLLKHRSGYSRLDGVRRQAQDPDKSLADLVQWISTLSLTHPPGQVTEYSNLNFALLGAVVERVSGQRYEDFTRQHIFEPLEMTNVYFSPQAAQAAAGAQGYFILFGVPVAHSADWVPAQIPAGYVYASAEDMTHYLQAYLANGHYHGMRLVEPLQPIGQSAQPGEFDQYWQWRTELSSPCTGHEGGTSNFNSQLIICPREQLGIILLLNSSPQRFSATVPSANTLANGVLEIVRGKTPAPLTDGGLYEAYRWFNLFSLALFLLALGELMAALFYWPRRWPTSHKIKRVLFYGLLIGDGLLAALFLVAYPISGAVTWQALLLDNVSDISLVTFSVGVVLLVTFAIKIVPVVRQHSRAQRHSLSEGTPQ